MATVMFLNIKLALAARGLKQFELAARIAIAPPVLSEVICGRRVADAKLRARMAKALRCDEAWLFSAPEVPEHAAMREAVA